MSERGEDLTLDQLSENLKTLAKQTKATKYREVMKLLRLVLSGLQVPADTHRYLKLTLRLRPQRHIQLRQTTV